MLYEAEIIVIVRRPLDYNQNRVSKLYIQLALEKQVLHTSSDRTFSGNCQLKLPRLQSQYQHKVS